MSEADQQTDDEAQSVNTARHQGEVTTDFGEMTTEELLDNL